MTNCVLSRRTHLDHRPIVIMKALLTTGTVGATLKQVFIRLTRSIPGRVKDGTTIDRPCRPLIVAFKRDPAEGTRPQVLDPDIQAVSALVNHGESGSVRGK
jgi:hypothetical protein